jgi:hypothetical protein
MTEERLSPPSDIPNFASLFRLGARDRAHAILAEAAEEMRGIGVDRGTIIRSLFDYFVHELGKITMTEAQGYDDPVEVTETINIINETNDRWRRMMNGWIKTHPDDFRSHIELES